MYSSLCLVHLLLRVLAAPSSACQAMPHRCDSAMPPVQDCVCCCRQVKSKEAEQALPDFNLAKVVGSRIQKQGFRQAVLLCVVRQPRCQPRGRALPSTAVPLGFSTSPATSEDQSCSASSVQWGGGCSSLWLGWCLQTTLSSAVCCQR